MSEGFFSSLPTAKKSVPLLPRCGACGLFKQCQSPKMEPTGKGRRKVLIVGEAPSKNEDVHGQQFVGEAGQRLQRTLDKIGVEMRKDCRFTNALICRPPRNRAPSGDEIDHCRPNLMNTIKEFQPETIILLGGAAVQSLLGTYWKADTGGILRWAGWRIPHQASNTWICPTFHPSYLNYEESAILDRLFEQHLRAAFALEGRPYDVVPDYASQVEIVFDDKRAAELIQKMVDRGNAISFDYETNMLKPDGDDAFIYTCSLSDGKTTFAYPLQGKAIEATKDFLRSDVPKSGHNCFSGDTKFLTREYGEVSLRSMVGKSIIVLNHEGRWVPAAVKSFGVQSTIEARFSRRNHQIQVRTTAGHEWIELGKDFRTRTDCLKKSDWRGPASQLPYLCANKTVTNVSEYVAGIKHGVILGDGAQSRPGNYQVRLCGHKRVLAKYFVPEHTRTYPKSYDGDPMIYLKRQRVEMKRPPVASVSDSYLIGFARGLLATDGCVASNGQVSLCNDSEIIRWCRQYLPRVGYLFQGETEFLKYVGRKYSGDYGLVKDVRAAYLSRESVSVEDFLLPHHRGNFSDVSLGPYKFSGLFGEEIKEEVFCAIVPDGNSFTLSGGLVTGNCKFEDRWSKAYLGVEVKNWQWCSMTAAHILDNRQDICGLKFQAFALLGQSSYDDGVRSFLEGKQPNKPNRIREAPLHELLKYNGLDSLLEWHVAKIQQSQMGVSFAEK